MTLKTKVNIFTVIMAIVGIVTIELFAIHKGIDGIALSSSVGSLALIVGYLFKPIKDKLK